MRLSERLREALAQPSAKQMFAGDTAVDTGMPPAETRGLIAAAVLIAITDRPDPGVILTLRRHDLRTHAGQIAFPGGRIDPGEDATRAAIREAHEELELDPNDVEPILELEPYVTVTGFMVTPVLAAIPPDLPLTPHDLEVADWFEAPLAHLLDERNHRLESVLFEGRQRHYYRIDWNGRMIWGATAAMIVNLSRRLRWS